MRKLVDFLNSRVYGEKKSLKSPSQQHGVSKHGFREQALQISSIPTTKHMHRNAGINEKEDK